MRLLVALALLALVYSIDLRHLTRSRVGETPESIASKVFFVVDVGSSGTRLYFFRDGVANVCAKPGNDPLGPEIAKMPTKTGVKAIIDNLWTLCKAKLKLEKTGTKPNIGIKDLLDSSDLDTSVANFLKIAKVYYAATAGVRLEQNADATKTDTFWAACKEYDMAARGSTDPKTVLATTIGGQYEGYFAFNSLVKNTDTALTQVVPNKDTAFYIEIGGASQQVAFKKCKTSFLETRSKVGGDVVIDAVSPDTVYSKSWLGDGSNRLTRNYLIWLAKKSSKKDDAEISTPCLIKGIEIKSDGSKVTLKKGSDLDYDSTQAVRAEMKDVVWDAGVKTALNGKTIKGTMENTDKATFLEACYNDVKTMYETEDELDEHKTQLKWKTEWALLAAERTGCPTTAVVFVNSKSVGGTAKKSAMTSMVTIGTSNYQYEYNKPLSYALIKHILTVAKIADTSDVYQVKDIEWAEGMGQTIGGIRDNPMNYYVDVEGLRETLKYTPNTEQKDPEDEPARIYTKCALCKAIMSEYDVQSGAKLPCAGSVNPVCEEVKTKVVEIVNKNSDTAENMAINFFTFKWTKTSQRKANWSNWMSTNGITGDTKAKAGEVCAKLLTITCT